MIDIIFFWNLWLIMSFFFGQRLIMSRNTICIVLKMFGTFIYKKNVRQHNVCITFLSGCPIRLARVWWKYFNCNKTDKVTAIDFYYSINSYFYFISWGFFFWRKDSKKLRIRLERHNADTNNFLKQQIKWFF